MKTILKSAGFLLFLAVAIQAKAQIKDNSIKQDTVINSQIFAKQHITLKSNFEQNLAIAYYKGKYGIIDKTGLWIVDPIFDWDGKNNEGFSIRVTKSQAK
jgi:hypothetical protein